MMRRFLFSRRFFASTASAVRSIPSSIAAAAAATSTSAATTSTVGAAQERSFQGMEIEFLGTSSMTATASRNVASTAVRLWGETWLVDCGEGTQRQLFVSPTTALSKISRILITHTHGDHVICFSRFLIVWFEPRFFFFFCLFVLRLHSNKHCNKINNNNNNRYWVCQAYCWAFRSKCRTISSSISRSLHRQVSAISSRPRCDSLRDASVATSTFLK